MKILWSSSTINFPIHSINFFWILRDIRKKNRIPFCYMDNKEYTFLLFGIGFFIHFVILWYYSVKPFNIREMLWNCNKQMNKWTNFPLTMRYKFWCNITCKSFLKSPKISLKLKIFREYFLLKVWKQNEIFAAEKHYNKLFCSKNSFLSKNIHFILK